MTPLTYQSVRPWLLTPRLARVRTNTFYFGGCGFVLFMVLTKWLMVFYAYCLAMAWDVCVLMFFGMAVAVERTVNAFHHEQPATGDGN